MLGVKVVNRALGAAGGGPPVRSTRGRGQRWRRWVRHYLRVVGVASLVGALLSVLGLLGLRSALAGVEEAAWRGASLLAGQLGEGLLEPQELVLNGQRLFVSSAVTDLGVGEALDRFSQECSNASAAVRPELQIVRRALVRRTEDERRGHLACLALHPELSSMRQLGDAVRSFAQSRDLAALGGVRVVRVRARPEGGSHALAFWTEGAFRPFELFAPVGEGAPRTSAGGVPAPAGARQDLSLSAPGRPYGLHGYHVPLPLDQALRYYDQALQAAGFTALDPAAWGLEWQEPGKDARVFSSGQGAVYVIGVAVGTGTRVLVMESAAMASAAAGGPVDDREMASGRVKGG
jgi:hypothetical protein